MALIERRTNSKGMVNFRVRIRLKGNPQETATFAKLADAKLWALTTEAAIKERRYFKNAEAKRRTFAELVERYQKTILPKKSASYHFVQCQHNQLDWWKSQLGAYMLTDLTASRIIEVRGKLNGSNATINRYMAALSHAFTIAVREWEWMDDTPMRKITRLKEPRGRVRFLSDEERDHLLKIVQQENPLVYLITILALSTGARKGELLNLRWGDIDLNRKRMTFQITKNGDRRSVTLGAYAVQMLQTYKPQETSTTALVFPGRYGTPMKIDLVFRKLVKLANIEDFRFHDLRHCAASYLAMNGASINDIAEVLGHKTLSMVKRYTHLSDTHTAGVVSRMNAAIFESQQRLMLVDSTT